MEPDTLDGTLRLLERWIALPSTEREVMGRQARLTFERRYDMRANAKSIVRIFEE